jgi:anthranilate phosphoribosyltransferase
MRTASDELKPFIAKLADGNTLSEPESEKAFKIIMSGEATQAQIGAFLMGLRARGETIAEITGAVRAMRAKALAIEAPEDAMDIVGTGGDNLGTYNISTAAAFVVAGAGVPVAKHGNRALSSKSGAADVLTALGVNIEADMPVIEEAIREANIGFLMAPRHHSAMRYVAGPRVEMGIRTIFNILGPLSNPAGVKRQFTGVFSKELVEPMAYVLKKLGCEHAWVVHGFDGLDELTTTGPSYVAELKDGKVTTFEVKPFDANIPVVMPEDLKGGTPEENACAIIGLLEGDINPFRDIVIYNAAASLIVSGKAEGLPEGVIIATESIDSGKAKAALDKLIHITNSGA